MSSHSLVRFLLLAGCMAGCAHSVSPASPASSTLTSAAKDAEGRQASARTFALAGFHALLVTGDAALAESRFIEAQQKDPGEPYALFGRHLLARRKGHPEQALSWALELCRRAPWHPLAAASARFALDLANASVSMDEQIQRQGALALAHGLPADAALLIRSAQIAIAQAQMDGPTLSHVLMEVGAPTRWSVVGPVSAFNVLSFDEVTQAERTGELSFEPPLAVRTLEFPTGRFSLSGESAAGDGYLLAVDADVAEGGAFMVRTASAASLRLYVDGTLLFARRSFERSEPTVSARGVALSPGRHRILIKLFKDQGQGELSLAVARVDGRPSNLRFSPAMGAPNSWRGIATFQPDHTYPSAKEFQAALANDAGEALSLFLAARDGLGRDRDGAKALLYRLPSDVSAAAVHGLWAELHLQDRTVPSRIGRGRAAKELEIALEKDKLDVFALLMRASLALDDGRYLQAADAVHEARARSTPPGYPIPLLQSRVEMGLGVEAQADARAQEALSLQPGLCEALQLRYDLARKKDAAAAQEALLSAMKGCAGQLVRMAEHYKLRGEVSLAQKTDAQLFAEDPTLLSRGLSLAQDDAAQGKTEEALRVLQLLAQSWPRSALVAKRRGEILELAGRKDEALRAKEQALLLNGGDLTLRRSVERARTGKELLDEWAIPTQAALQSYKASVGAEDATSALVLDAAAVRVYPDGTQVDRVHIIQKALDQAGVAQVAEVALPANAQVLALRTLKADGTVLEPESIEGKESVSLPGVQVGDYVEYEYLLAHPPRGPTMPGFTASSFYFRIAREPNSWSTYTVVAPKGTGLRVDAHGASVQPVRTENSLEVFSHQERQVPPFIPEPDAPPMPSEYLPFVTVGAGAVGQDSLLMSVADDSHSKAQLTYDVESFARAAVGDKRGKQAVEALYAAVMKRISGKDAGLSQSASATLAQERGSRLMLLKASLHALGIPARLAVIRTFLADPTPYLFPNDALLTYACLRVSVEGQEIWLDPLVRFAPFGVLPEQAMGGREAYLLPEPGLPLERTRTPAGSGPQEKSVRLDLSLSDQGILSGVGEEVYQGIDAAQLSETLEAMSAEARSQALQQAISRYFGGADLSEVKVESQKEVGANLRVRYRFTAPNFARVEGEKMVLQPLTFPTQLGRRFVQLSQRKTPLFIDGTEQTHTFVTLKLPKGYQLTDPIAETRSQGPSGNFLRREGQEKDVLAVEERFELHMARIPPAQYDAFAKFAGEVDLLQTRDLVVERR